MLCCAFPFVSFSPLFGATTSGANNAAGSSEGVLKKSSDTNTFYSDDNTIDNGKDSSRLIVKSSRSIDSLKKTQDSQIRLSQTVQAIADVSLQHNNTPNSFADFESANKDLFRTLGGYHRLMGMYEMIGGVLTIIAGAMLLDKKDATTFAMSFFALGGVSIGLGLWEIKVGAKLLNYRAKER
jgi:hypothetical protein